MLAVWYERQGPAHEVLQLGEMPVPEPRRGEVRVRVLASAVNPADANRRAGRLHGMEYPCIVPHSDGAGVVDATGEGVGAHHVGSRVWLHFGQRGRAHGTAAEYICLPLELTSPLPAHLSAAQGACLGIPCMTAFAALFDTQPIAGQTVLVTGGAGSVGHYAIQLAKWGQARVITTVSSAAKAAHARSAGADVVINYTEPGALAQLQHAAPGGIQRIVDVDAVANSAQVLQTAADNAVWVSYAIGPQTIAALPMAQIIRKNIRLQGVYLPGMDAGRRHSAQQGIARWLQEVPDSLHAIDSHYTLANTASAHEAVEGKTKMGAVIVQCGDPGMGN